MKKIFFTILLSLLLLFLVPAKVNAASTRTWDGGGSTNNWSEDANWSSDTAPVAGDSVVFNATSTKDSTVDASFGGSIGTIAINSGYTGTITLARSLNTTTIASSFAQSAGHFNASNQTLDVDGSFTLNSGADFTASSGTMFVGAALAINSGSTFTNNSGTVTIDGTNSAALNCNNVTFNSVRFAHTGGAKTVNSTCSLPLGSNPTLGTGTSATAVTLTGGTLSGSGTLTTGIITLNSGAVLSGFTGLVGGSNVTISGATINLSSYTTVDLNGSFIFSSGSFTAPTGTMTIAGALTISGSPTFNANGGTITFDGNTAVTLACNNVTFNLVNISHLANSNAATITKTVNSDCNLPLGNNPTLGTATSTTAVTLNGTLSGSGTLTTGILTLNSGAVLSGFSGLVGGATVTVSGATINLGSYTTVDINSNFILSSGTFTAPTGTMTISGNLTISGTPTFNANSGTITFDGATSATLACNNVTFSTVSFNATNTKTVGSDCSLPLGSNPTSTNSVVSSGPLSGSGTLTFNTGTTLLLNSGGNISGFSNLVLYNLSIDGATINLGSSNQAQVNSNFNLFSGTFTASPAMTVSGDWNNLGGTFNSNNGTVTMDGANQTEITGNNTFYNFTKTVTNGSSQTLTFNSGSTQTFTGKLTLQASLSNRLLLRSSVVGMQWALDPEGSRNISQVDVQDSRNINIVPINVNGVATDSGDNSGWDFSGSAISPVFCNSTPPSSAPKLISLKQLTSRSVKLDFKEASRPLDSYFVEYGLRSDHYQYASGNIGGKGTNSYTVNFLVPGVVYFFRVRAGNGCAAGPWSNELSNQTSSAILSNTSAENPSVASPKTESSNEEVENVQNKENVNWSSRILLVDIILSLTCVSVYFRKRHFRLSRLPRTSP